MTVSGTQPPGITTRVAAEIRALRKGRGVNAPDLIRRLGPNLHELVASGCADQPTNDRQVLITEFNNHAARLVRDLRIAIATSLGLTVHTKHMPHFEDRMAWLADHLGCGNRTAVRRVGEAEQVLAEEIVSELARRRGRTTTSPSGWRLEEFKTLLRMDTQTPEAHEHRRIVATHDDLTEVMAWMDVPRGPEQPRPRLSVEIAYGGQLVRREQPSPNRFHFVVRLPTALRAGETHEYGLVIRIPDGEVMRPHYIFTPECQCNSFILRVRFDVRRAPRWVRRVHAETVRMFDHAEPAGDLVSLDAAGEACVRFNNPTMYLGYGLQWHM